MLSNSCGSSSYRIRPISIMDLALGFGLGLSLCIGGGGGIRGRGWIASSRAPLLTHIALLLAFLSFFLSRAPNQLLNESIACILYIFPSTPSRRDVPVYSSTSVFSECVYVRPAIARRTASATRDSLTDTAFSIRNGNDNANQ